MNSKIWLSSPHMGTSELGYVKEAFDTNWIAPLGPLIDGFENDLATYLGNGTKVLALNSGTAALHLALILADVQAGDEVICQSFTFTASANPILYQGGTPVFVDSETETWNMSPYWLKVAIEDRLKKGKKLKAIIPVHLYGMPARIRDIIAIANNFNIPVIEDAAESLGATCFSQATGTFGLMGILSFNSNKVITTSGGGALVSRHAELIRKAHFLATQARDVAPHYEHSHLGYNYRMSNISAGIGRGQMEVLSERIKQRRNIYNKYLQELGFVPGISFLSEPENFFSSRWLTTILIDTKKTDGVGREEIQAALAEENIESRPLMKPMHLQPVFKNAPFYGDGTSEKLFDKGLCLPSGSNMTNEEQERVINLVKTYFR